jgi:hypothetical protein
MTLAETEEYNKQISSFKRKGLTQNPDSSFAASLLFVPESEMPNGSKALRLIIAYRVLNDITINNRFRLPLSDELLEK